jgi:hypothetical protein
MWTNDSITNPKSISQIYYIYIYTTQCHALISLAKRPERKVELARVAVEAAHIVVCHRAQPQPRVLVDE